MLQLDLGYRLRALRSRAYVAIRFGAFLPATRPPVPKVLEEPGSLRRMVPEPPVHSNRPEFLAISRGLMILSSLF